MVPRRVASRDANATDVERVARREGASRRQLPRLRSATPRAFARQRICAPVRATSLRVPEMKSAWMWVSVTCVISSPPRQQRPDIHVGIANRIHDDRAVGGPASDEITHPGELRIVKAAQDHDSAIRGVSLHVVERERGVVGRTKSDRRRHLLRLCERDVLIEHEIRKHERAGRGIRGLAMHERRAVPPHPAGNRGAHRTADR